MAVSDLAAMFPVSRPAVSQHLKVLKEAGLVRDRKNGTRRVYQVDPEGVARLRAHFDSVWERAVRGFQRAAMEASGKEASGNEAAGNEAAGNEAPRKERGDERDDG
jgi:DNA-binding transcriptional regulator GbsR (MarR family)